MKYDDEQLVLSYKPSAREGNMNGEKMTMMRELMFNELVVVSQHLLKLQ